ncbi:MAG: hypothetical protein LC808_17580, partial [Actinobacteria bacterium]|nr:hypothetical protein [Actinomycetota bacterium]
MALPDPVANAMVRGMAAYMQAARPTDLPVALRPLRGKHMKMLNAHKREILSALDDEGLRALVLEWLDDKPAGITKADAAILRTAVTRDGDWATTLAGAGPGPVTRKASSVDLTAAIQREKERTRKVKEEARRAQQQSDSHIAEARKEVLELTTKVGELTRNIVELEGSLSAAQRAADAARARMDREVRKARKGAEKAAGALEASKATVKELRAEITRMKAAATPSASRTRSPAAPEVHTEPTRRRRLPVPKGRFEDDPETLAGWLTTPLVHL